MLPIDLSGLTQADPAPSKPADPRVAGSEAREVEEEEAEAEEEEAETEKSDGGEEDHEVLFYEDDSLYPPFTQK